MASEYCIAAEGRFQGVAFGYPKREGTALGKEIYMIWFVLGSILGGTVGLFSAAMCAAAGNGDSRKK